MQGLGQLKTYSAQLLLVPAGYHDICVKYNYVHYSYYI